MDKIEKQKDIFESAIRSKLTGATVEPSAQLWDRVSVTLEESAKVSPLLLFVSWSSASAAVIAVAIAANVWLNSHSAALEIETKTIAEIAQFKEIESQPIALKSILLQHPTPQFATKQQEIVQKEVAEEVNGIEVEEVETKEEPQASNKTTQQQERTKNIEEYKTVSNSYSQLADSEKTKSKGVDISLMMAGVTNSSSSSNIDGFSPHLLSAPAYGYTNLITTKYYTPSSVEHHTPITFALSAAYRLDERWSIESGLSYSYLSSDVTMSYSGQELKQELQFIGLPLRLNYHIYQTSQFLLYTGLGTQIERNISAKLNSHKIDEKPWHWSLDGVVGAQYNINSWLGIYTEPEITYYMTPTKLTTIRTDSPLMFNFRFGLRFSFGSR